MPFSFPDARHAVGAGGRGNLSSLRILAGGWCVSEYSTRPSGKNRKYRKLCDVSLASEEVIQLVC
jgi:hypothetical protein